MQISKAGNWNKNSNDFGFTLIELIVVLFILSSLTFLILPSFKPSPKGKQNHEDLVRLMTNLRQQAIIKRQTFFLHLDVSTDSAWATTTGLIEDEGKILFLDNLSLTGGEIPNQDNPEHMIIRFFSEGYSDMALVHLTDGKGEDRTIKLHPFLQEPEVIAGDESIDDCN